MLHVRALGAAFLAAALAACGPHGRDPQDENGDTGDMGDDPGASVTGATLYGTVWAPGNGPLQVAKVEHAIPVAGAAVWLTQTRPDPIPDEAYCDPCTEAPRGAVTSDAKGNFELKGVAKGEYILVIQKGQFRLERIVRVDTDQTMVLAPEATTLPSIHDPANGMWTPRVALAEGQYDKMHDILGKMGFGMVNASGELITQSIASNDRFHIYRNVGGYWTGGDGYDMGLHGAVAQGTLNDLVRNLDRMLRYHIIFIPCSNGPTDALFGDPKVRQNIRDYVAAGGKFYVTDWSAEWEDAVFPEFIVFKDVDTTPDMAAAGNFASGNGFGSYSSSAAKAVDENLAAWLDGQKGPIVTANDTYSEGTIDADAFFVEGNWDKIESTPSIQIGTDNEGLPVNEQAKAWVMGDWTSGEGPIHPLTVTFEPGGCGRVLYSTYHTADSVHAGLVPQERVLLYLVMEIGVCKAGPIIE